MFKFIIIWVSMVAATYGQTCGERQYLHDGLCCEKCRPGQFVKKNCSAVNDTTCEPCQVGTIMITYNEKSECDSCGHRQYFDINLLFCMDCVACPEGQYPAEKCSKLSNTRCLECPEGHFSNITDNFNRSCQPCTNCKEYLARCTREKDAICRLNVKEKPTPNSITVKRKRLNVPKPTTVTVENTTTVKKDVNRSTSNSPENTYTFLILIIVLSIVFSLMIFFIYRFKMANKKFQCNGGSRILNKSSKHEPLRTGFLLRDQPSSFIFKLAEYLTAEGRPNWKNLADNFNDFTYSEIANFEVDKTTAAEKMLGSWQTKNTSTVDKLHRCLINIKRDDVASYVSNFVTSLATPV